MYKRQFRDLPALSAANLTGVVAFGYFVFKAGYAQSELLFYFLFFLAFLACWHLLQAPGRLRLAAGAGVLAALAHLTKAALLPFVAVFLLIYIAAVVARRLRHGTLSLIREVAVPAVMCAAFLAVLSPYLLNSKRTFGSYFYNVNTTFYAWYDNWAEASVGTLSHGDGVAWPDMPAEQIPSAAKYWRSHTTGQIASRVAGGITDMLARSYRTYAYFKYVAWYLAMLAVVILSNTAAFTGVVRRNAALVAFLVLYGLSHLLLIAFYAPVSGTGTTRFLIAHLTPFFYAASRYLSHPEVVGTAILGAPVGVRHLQVVTGIMLALDVAFWIWPRVLTTYGGF